jgi:toxin CcdB
MARFDVRPNLHKGSRERVPYLLEIQSDLLSDLSTRVVAPLVPASKFGPAAARLNPSFRIEGKNHVMDTGLIAGVSGKILGESVANLSGHSTEILSAIDFLISGI